MSQRRACPSTWRLRQGISGDLRKGSGPAEKLHGAEALESVLTAAQSSEQRRPRCYTEGPSAQLRIYQPTDINRNLFVASFS